MLHAGLAWHEPAHRRFVRLVPGVLATAYLLRKVGAAVEEGDQPSHADTPPASPLPGASTGEETDAHPKALLGEKVGVPREAKQPVRQKAQLFLRRVQPPRVLALVEVELFLVGNSLDDQAEDARGDGQRVIAVERDSLLGYAGRVPRDSERQRDGGQQQILRYGNEEKVEDVVQRGRHRVAQDLPAIVLAVPLE